MCVSFDNAEAVFFPLPFVKGEAVERDLHRHVEALSASLWAPFHAKHTRLVTYFDDRDELLNALWRSSSKCSELCTRMLIADTQGIAFRAYRVRVGSETHSARTMRWATRSGSSEQAIDKAEAALYLTCNLEVKATTDWKKLLSTSFCIPSLATVAAL
jgi:hypothetical protein